MAPPPDMHYTMVARRASKRDSDVLGDRKKFDVLNIFFGGIYGIGNDEV